MNMFYIYGGVLCENMGDFTSIHSTVVFTFQKICYIKTF